MMWTHTHSDRCIVADFHRSSSALNHGTFHNVGVCANRHLGAVAFDEGSIPHRAACTESDLATHTSSRRYKPALVDRRLVVGQPKDLSVATHCSVRVCCVRACPCVLSPSLAVPGCVPGTHGCTDALLHALWRTAGAAKSLQFSLFRKSALWHNARVC